MSTHLATLDRLAREQSPFRGKAAFDAGVPWAYLGRAVSEGRLQRLSRGLYAAPSYTPSANGSLAEISRLVPAGTIGLLSAMRFHGLTTQVPHAVWLLVNRRSRRPSRAMPAAIECVGASGAALTMGIESHEIDGVPVPITSVAKTVCDGFRHRSRIGLDVAIEALRDALEGGGATPGEILELAREVRIGTVIRPYVEALA